MGPKRGGGGGGVGGGFEIYYCLRERNMGRREKERLLVGMREGKAKM